MGVRLAGQPQDALQPSLGGSAGRALVGAQEVRVVGPGAAQMDRVRRSRLPRGKGPGYAREAGWNRHGRSLRLGPLYPEGGRPRMALRPQRTQGWSLANPLRAARIADHERALRSAKQPGRQAFAAKGQPAQPARRPSLSVCRDHLPRYGAVPLGRDVALERLARGAHARDVRGNQSRAGGDEGPSEQRLDGGLDTAWRDRMSGARDQADAPAKSWR